MCRSTFSLHGPILPCFAGHSEVNLRECEPVPQRPWAIQIHNLRFSYPSPLAQGNPVPALRGIDLAVAEGEFLALMGPVGAGKSTLCYALNGAIPHAIDGNVEGEVVVLGQATDRTPMGQLSTRVGLVFEDIDAQLFNATVTDEVAFGLEGMGLPVAEIERRIDLALDLVGLSGLRARSPRTLSGGERKRLALASVLAMRPRVLVLDEPTQGLDPLARQTVIEAIDRLRRQDGQTMTVIMATLDAETAARFADRIAVLDAGQIVLSGPPSQVFARVDELQTWGVPIPQLVRLAHDLSQRCGRPVDPSDMDWARSALRDLPSLDRSKQPQEDAEVTCESLRREAVIQVRCLGHRYPTSDQWALCDCSLHVASGEWLAIIGINGSGKSTLIKHLNGLLKPTEGTVRVDGADTRSVQIGELARAVGYLPQNPDHLIFSPTVRQEVAFGPRQQGLKGAMLDEQVSEALELLNLAPYADHPPAVLGYSLRRKVALASVLSMRTPVLALDEPTAGLDQQVISRLFDAISVRHRLGTTVIMVTHELHWVARYAQRVMVLYRGRVAAQGRPADVLGDPDLLREVDLYPLPVTELARSLDWAQPLPVSVEGFCARACGG